MRRIRAKIRRAAVRSTISSMGTKISIDTTHSRDSVLNCRANATATTTPTLMNEALMIRRTSSPARATARAR